MVSKEEKKEYNKTYREKKKLEKEKKALETVPVAKQEPLNEITIPVNEPVTELVEEQDETITIPKAELFKIFDQLDEYKKKDSKPIEKNEIQKNETVPPTESLLTKLGSSMANSIISSAGNLAVPIILMGITSIWQSSTTSQSTSQIQSKASEKPNEQQPPPFQILTGNLY